MATKKETKKKSVGKKEAKKVVHITPEVIYDVIHGKYGAEGERNRKLLAAGYNPSAVTKKINDLKKLAEQIKPIKEKVGDYYECLRCLIED